MELTGIDFSVHFDQTTGTIRLADTGVYPPGVQSGIRGYFDVTQPDGIKIPGSPLAPSVLWNGLSLSFYLMGMRLASGGCVQNGQYTISYTINHPSYDTTTLSRTFNVFFDKIVGTLSKEFDVFTPDLKVRDTTAYAQAGWIASVLRNWSFTIVDVAAETELTTPNDFVDLMYLGSYYDAQYLVSLAALASYTSVDYPWLTVAQTVLADLDTYAQTPGSFENLISRLQCLKEQYDSEVGCVKSTITSAKYAFATALFDHMVNLIRIGNSFAGTVLENYLTATAECGDGSYVPLNAPILPFDLNQIVSTTNDIVIQNIGGQFGLYKDFLGINPKTFRFKTIRPVGLLKIEDANDYLSLEYKNKDAFTFNTDTGRTIPAGYLIEKILVIPIATGLTGFRIGVTPGGEEIVMAQPMLQNVPKIYYLERYSDIQQVIYVSGILGETKFVIFLEKIL